VEKEEEEEEKVLGDEMCVHGLTLPSSNCVYSKIRPPWEIYERERERRILNAQKFLAVFLVPRMLGALQMDHGTSRSSDFCLKTEHQLKTTLD